MHLRCKQTPKASTDSYAKIAPGFTSSSRQPSSLSSKTRRRPVSSVPTFARLCARKPVGQNSSQNSNIEISPSPSGPSTSDKYLHACSLSTNPDWISSSIVTEPLASLSKFLNTAASASNSSFANLRGVGALQVFMACSLHQLFICFKSEFDEQGQIILIMSSSTNVVFLPRRDAPIRSHIFEANFRFSSAVPVPM